MSRSCLKELGVNRIGIRKIHSNMSLEHNATFNKVANKSVVSDAIKHDSKSALAIDKDGNTFCIGPWGHERWGNAYLMKIVSPEGRTEHIAAPRAMRKVAGRGWKWYVSDSACVTKDRNYAIEDKPAVYDNVYNEIITRFNKGFMAVAKKEYEKVYAFLLEEIHNEDSKRNLDDIKKNMYSLKHISTKGISSVPFGHSSYGGVNEGLRSFFNSSYGNTDYELNEFAKEQKLPLEKFAKFVMQKIRNISDYTITGSYTGNCDRADSYKK